MAVYVAELKRLSTHCQFKDYIDDALRDCLVCGLRKESTQKRLLVEDKLTFTIIKNGTVDQSCLVHQVSSTSLRVIGVAKEAT